MASFLFNAGKTALLNGTITFTSTTLKVMLIGPGYTPDADDTYVSAVSAYELSGTGYAGGYGGSGRKTLASKTVAADDVNDWAVADAADLTWSSINAGTVVGVVILYETGGSDSTARLLYFGEVEPYLTDGGNYDLVWPDTGIFSLV